MRSRKRKKAQPLPWTPILWGLVVLQLVLGIQLSGIFRMYRVRVIGAQPGDEKRISVILNEYKLVPSLRVPATKIEERVLLNPRLQQAHYEQNLFGRGVLKITPEELVARVGEAGQELTPMMLTRSGTLLKASGTSERQDLPAVFLQKGWFRPSVLLMAPWEAGHVAAFAVELKKEFPTTPARVTVDARGMIFLRFSASGQVRMGSSEKLPEKTAKLKQILASDPELLDRVKEINLTVPEQPVQVPKSR